VTHLTPQRTHPSIYLSLSLFFQVWYSLSHVPSYGCVGNLSFDSSDGRLSHVPSDGRAGNLSFDSSDGRLSHVPSDGRAGNLSFDSSDGRLSHDPCDSRVTLCWLPT
jgi:hypothetical protein